MRICIIGGGVAGITAAYLLHKKHHVTLLEKSNYLGGHTNTRVVEDPLYGPIDIDTGFIVCNAKNYPNFYKFLSELGVKLKDSNMSFGFHCAQTKTSYLGPSIKEFIKIPGNLLKTDMLRMLYEQYKFNKRALKDLNTGNLKGITLLDYCKKLGLSSYFHETYIIPLASAIWSASASDINQFPAISFLTFFNNHGMLELMKFPQWQTVVGGSHSYIKAFKQTFTGDVFLDSQVLKIKREQRQVIIKNAQGQDQKFDIVIMAAHADESLAMLENVTKEEKDALGSWRYSRSEACLHTDAGLLPESKNHWAAWNYCRGLDYGNDSSVQITYYMNKLQRIKSKIDYFVTLNCTKEIDPVKVIYKTDYSHPVYTEQSVRSQGLLRTINGRNRTYYCGSYLGYGFHEDAVSSAYDVAQLIKRTE